MSRSYKRTPPCGDRKDKFFKKAYNKRLRKLPFECDLNGCIYKKYNQWYEICDYDSVGTSFEDYWRHLKRRFHDQPQVLGTKEEAYKEYIKWFIRK